MRQLDVEALSELVASVCLETFGLSLQEHLQELRRSARALSLRPDLGHPCELGGGFLLEDEDLVVGHPLLRDDHLLAAVDDEVAALVVLAVLARVHSVVSVEIAELTELRAKHDWNLADHDSGLLVLTDDLLHLPPSLPSLRVNLLLMSVELFL